MKNIKSYLKTPLFWAGIYAASFAIFTLASCVGGNGKSLPKVQSNPATTYRDYLSDIRQRDNASFKVLTECVRQWQTVKDSVFTRLRQDTLSPTYSGLREECTMLHDSIRIEFSRLVLSQARTYQELLALKQQFSPYGKDEELHHAVEEIRPFFRALDHRPAFQGNKEQMLTAYRALLSATIRYSLHNRNDLTAYITKEDAVFRAFLTHLHDLDGMNMADITRDTERCCSQIFFAAERKEITYREAMLYLAMRTNRRQIQNMQACIDDIRHKRINTPAQAQAYIWMLINPFVSLDGFSITLLSDQEQKLLDKMAAQTPGALETLSTILQTKTDRLQDLPGMLMEIFIHTL